jgi:hypothetical protein
MPCMYQFIATKANQKSPVLACPFLPGGRRGRTVLFRGWRRHRICCVCSYYVLLINMWTRVSCCLVSVTVWTWLLALTLSGNYLNHFPCQGSYVVVHYLILNDPVSELGWNCLDSRAVNLHLSDVSYISGPSETPETVASTFKFLAFLLRH